MALIRKDDKGLYVKHGDWIVRPVASKPLEHETYLEGQEYSKGKGSLLRTKNFSEFNEGDRIDKHHIGQTTRVRLKNADHNETWYIQYGEHQPTKEKAQ